MAIGINIIESAKQIIAGIPEYISVEITGVTNAIVYYTLDDSNPDPMSLATLIMEHGVGDPLHGTIFLPTNTNLLDLNMLAVGVSPDDTATFYRRYGLDTRKIGIGRPGIKKIISGGTAYTNTASPNIDPITGLVIANDGYTEGYGIAYNITEDGYDGYVDGYRIATSGVKTTIPPVVYDHIDGYTNSDDGYTDGYATTTLTPGQELNLLRLTNKGPIWVDNGSGGVLQSPNFIDRDPRSNTIVDSDGDQIEVIPVEDFPESADGYTVDADGYSIDIDYDNTIAPATTNFTSGGMFDPRAAYIEIDGRIDGYINGTPIRPGDRTIINKPYGELRYNTRREDLGDALRTTIGYISGGLVCPIYDYARGQAAFYYWDNHDYRWVVSLQKITAPDYKIFAQRNGVVVGQVFKWIVGKRQVLPGY